ncbi:putative leucine-rich repeat-containing protein DDB_G0290503 [Pomacea canaliculata]|nr:putative leucine-rich repeat-containing protein DDB_G0290503 [Pomacea canaliculata]
MLHGLPDITRRSSSDGASPIAMTHNPTMSNKSRGQQPKRRALDSDSDDTDAKTLWKHAVRAPDVQGLLRKVEDMELRLEELENLIGLQRMDSEKRQQQKKELEQSRQEIAELRKQLQEAMVTLETRNKELQDTQKKVETLTNQSTADRHKIDRLENENKKLQQLVGELENKLNDRIKKIGKLERQLSDVQRELNQTHTRVNSLETGLQQLQQNFAALVAGTLPTSSTTPEKPSPRQPLASLGLPPIAIPASMQNQSNRGGQAMNFPPK